MNKILLIGIALMFSFSNVPSMGQTALIGAEVPISPSKTLPEPAMVYQYGGKDNHKDKEAFNNHLNGIRSTAVLQKDTIGGWYNHSADEFYSKSKAATIHEQGHRLDLQVLGNPSVESNFAKEVSKVSNIKKVYSDLRTYYPNDLEFYMELYATLWQLAGGDINNIPPSLKIFYTNEWVWDK